MLPILLIPIAFLLLLFRELWDLFRDRRRFSLLIWVIILLTSGTVYYARVEQWSYTDSLYFCVVSLVTVGYGDLSPTTTGAKMFTIVYILLGLGIILAFINTLARDREQILEKRVKHKEEWDIE